MTVALILPLLNLQLIILMIAGVVSLILAAIIERTAESYAEGIAILLTTELGLLDACARISTDIIKVNWLRDNDRWTDSRLYYTLLWGQIGIGCMIMLIGLAVPDLSKPLVLLVLSAALNGGVMLVYSGLLLWLSKRVLGGSLRLSPIRLVAMIWACGFFGYFTIITLESELPKLF